MRLHTAEGHVIELHGRSAGEGRRVDIVVSKLGLACCGIDHHPLQTVHIAFGHLKAPLQFRPLGSDLGARTVIAAVRHIVRVPKLDVVSQLHRPRGAARKEGERPRGVGSQASQLFRRNLPCRAVVEGLTALGKQGVSAGIHRVGHPADAAALRVRFHTAEGHVIGDIAAGEGYVVNIIAAQLPGAGNGIDHNPIQRVGENAVFQRPCAGQRRPFAVGQNRRRIEVLVRRAVVIPEFQIVTEGHVPRSGANLHVQRPEVLIGQRPKRGSRNGPCGAVIALRPSFGEKGVVPDIHDGIRPGDAAALRIGLRAADAHVILRQ